LPSKSIINIPFENHMVQEHFIHKI